MQHENYIIFITYISQMREMKLRVIKEVAQGLRAVI